ncbi:MAG TPA: hypothetical protein VKH62_17175 [Candidatus Binatia bacterium]|nr:hypothetical protein [Candidatus Binatia bacterium]
MMKLVSLHTRLIALLADLEVAIGAGVAFGKHVRAIKNKFFTVNGIHDQRCIGNGEKFHRLARAVDETMPGIERRCEKAPRPPFEHLLTPAFLPHFCGALAGENTDDFFVKMFLAFERASGRNLADIHAGHALHAVKIDERSIAAGAGPRRHRQIADIFHAVAIDHWNILARHPFEVLGFLKGCHQSCYALVLRQRILLRGNKIHYNRTEPKPATELEVGKPPLPEGSEFSLSLLSK